MKTSLQAVAISLVAAILALFVSYHLLLWAFIRCWEWQHDGRRMMFAFWADERAMPLALIICAAVFYFTLKRLRSRRSS